MDLTKGNRQAFIYKDDYLFVSFAVIAPDLFQLQMFTGLIYDSMAHICVCLMLLVVSKKMKIVYNPRFLILTQSFSHDTYKNAVTLLRRPLIDGGKVLCKC